MFKQIVNGLALKIWPAHFRVTNDDYAKGPIMNDWLTFLRPFLNFDAGIGPISGVATLKIRDPKFIALLKHAYPDSFAYAMKLKVDVAHSADGDKVTFTEVA